MDEPRRWFRDDEPIPGGAPQPSYSLAMVFRILFLAALALGWFRLIRVVPADSLMLAILLAGAVLGSVVGIRRRGSRWMRISAGGGFFAGCVVLATYSGLVAFAIQLPAEPEAEQHWGGLDVCFWAGVLVLAVPAMIVVLVLLLRSWMWSVHDRELPGQRR